MTEKMREGVIFYWRFVMVNASEEKGLSIWMAILDKVLKLPGVRINREEYLKKELLRFYSEEEIDLILKKAIKNSCIDIKKLDTIANAAINYHTTIATGLSVVAGIPGGVAALATIPTDLTQFYAQVLMVAQKLSFIYGWGNNYTTEPDEEFKYQMTLFIGAMSGAKVSYTAIKTMAREFAKQVEKRLPQVALTKYAFYNIAKQVAKWLGISLTKKSFAKGLAKIIPYVSGLISGVVTVATFKPMAKRLQKVLKDTDLIKSGEKEVILNRRS